MKGIGSVDILQIHYFLDINMLSTNTVDLDNIAGGDGSLVNISQLPKEKQYDRTVKIHELDHTRVKHKHCGGKRLGYESYSDAF